MYLLVPALIGHGGRHRTNRGLWRLVAVGGLGAARQQKQCIWIESMARTGKWIGSSVWSGRSIELAADDGRWCWAWSWPWLWCVDAASFRHLSAIHPPSHQKTHSHAYTQMHAHTPNATTHL
ncbi:hypothetical protein BGZ61DRAFT_458606, partial [Ilyonectria robusta]|uniref:uncharacterized protein n=1 Tax=Ilyonectria robusta TaxID=1079257 RepID=UPI001E8D4222